MEKYLITYNETEVISVSEHNGGTVMTGTNAMITTLDDAIVALTALNIDATKVNEEIARVNQLNK